jgi:hypothetical protein
VLVSTFPNPIAISAYSGANDFYAVMGNGLIYRYF